MKFQSYKTPNVEETIDGGINSENTNGKNERKSNKCINKKMEVV